MLALGGTRRVIRRTCVDLDLEADLGIDTVKQAEVFGRSGSGSGSSATTSGSCGTPTLAHVVAFVEHSGAGREAAPSQCAGARRAAVPPGDASIGVEGGGVGGGGRQDGWYPSDILDRVVELEADLGIDTVKQAEVFRLHPEGTGSADDSSSPRLPHARARPLRHDRAPRPEARQRGGRRRVDRAGRGRPSGADRFPRHVPVASGPRWLCVADRRRVGRGRSSWLTARRRRTGLPSGCEAGVEVLAIEGDPGRRRARGLRSTGGSPPGPLQGVYWLDALDDEGPVEDMDLAAWREANACGSSCSHSTMRGRRPGRCRDVPRYRHPLGGRHGYDDAGGPPPLGGAVTGFAKAFARERTTTLVKEVDFGRSRSSRRGPTCSSKETLRDPARSRSATRRVAVDGRTRRASGRRPRRGHGSRPRDRVRRDRGGRQHRLGHHRRPGRGVGRTFHLLDLVPEPDPTTPTRALRRRPGRPQGRAHRSPHAAGERPTPMMVESSCGSSGWPPPAAIDAVRRPVVRLLPQRRPHRRRRGCAGHRRCGGGSRSHRRAAPCRRARHQPRPARQGARRSPTSCSGSRADGWFNLMEAIGDLPLVATVAFSSVVAGRFGNLGQTDQGGDERPVVQAGFDHADHPARDPWFIVDWTAWSGIGMASGGSIPTVMDAAGSRCCLRTSASRRSGGG